MNLTHLQHFVAVADNGSVRLAAESLGITQPAISRSLRALETTLGVSLLIRDSKGSRLTESGEVLHERAKLITNEIDRIPVDLAELAGDPDDVVRIACSATLGIDLLPSVLEDFHERYPKVQLHVMGGLPSSHLSQLADGSLDLVIGARPRGALPASIEVHDLFTVSTVIAVRQTHPLRTAKSLEDFAESQWVLPSAAFDVAADLQAAFKAIRRSAPRIAMRSDSLYFVQALVASTDYVTLIPEPLLKVVIASSGLREVRVPELQSQDAVALFVRSNRRLSRAATQLASALKLGAKLHAKAGRDSL